MMHFMSAWTGKKAVLLGVALSLYTFTLMYVFRVVEHSNYSLLPSVRSRHHSSSLIDSNYSRRSVTGPLIVSTIVIPDEDVRYNVDTPIISPVIQNDEQREIPSMKHNVEPWDIQSVKQNVELQDILSMKQNVELRDIQSAKLNLELQDIHSVKQNVEPLKFLPVKMNGGLPEIPPFRLSKASQKTLSVKLNVRHNPRNDRVFFQKSKSSRDSSSYFRPRLYGPALELLIDTMAMFDLTMTRNGLEYMLYGGSLIGSYRHHGLVPWDDDIDVLVPLSTQTALYLALSSLSPQYILNKDWNFSWKLFSARSDEIRGYSWKWPYLDIFFYAENDTHIWDAAPQYRQNYVFPKSIVFPLRRRPFMGLRLLTPHNSRAVIATNYDVTLCQSGKWIHKWERYGIETSMRCSLLYFKFPFVFRTFQNGGCNESLIHNNIVVGYYFQEDTSCDR